MSNVLNMALANTFWLQAPDVMDYVKKQDKLWIEGSSESVVTPQEYPSDGTDCP
jgi:hypothetical protein